MKQQVKHLKQKMKQKQQNQFFCCIFVPHLSYKSVTFFVTGKLNTTIFNINNNTPSRLTSVAHLGGFSLYTGL